ncbi:MAG: cupin domain-containing protein [Planctomycetes bacterium]|nr:cupin domain-containing protein [Planctomycetota bacterium]MBM4081778.1 cupin domain-containing protein [Planctomycetota bacterium]MBM4085522.1 cupin domain-containing protein [Planctomycetota bacterium]
MQHVNEHELKYRKGDSGPKYLFRGPKIDWGVLRFLPGQELGQHRHERVEETFYFTRGTPLMIVGGQQFRVKPGDAFRLDPGDVHNIVNDTQEPIDAVFIKSSFDPEDKVDVK